MLLGALPHERLGHSQIFDIFSIIYLQVPVNLGLMLISIDNIIGLSDKYEGFSDSKRALCVPWPHHGLVCQSLLVVSMRLERIREEV